MALSVAERIMVEEFNERCPNQCKLKVALSGYPGLDDLKPVAAFTDEEKVHYVRVIRAVEEAVKYKKAANAGLVPLLDIYDESEFQIPSDISRAYLATVIGSI